MGPNLTHIIYSRLSVKDTAMPNFQVNKMGNCIASVLSSMTVNKLKLNKLETQGAFRKTLITMFSSVIIKHIDE